MVSENRASRGLAIASEHGHTDKGPQRRCALEVLRWPRVGAQSFGADLGLRDEGDCA